MRIARISFNFNHVSKKINAKSPMQYQIDKNSTSLTLPAFGAKIPSEILSRQKYAGLLNTCREYGKNLAYLYDSNILKSLQALKSDDTVSNEFKSRLLLDNDNSYFISRVEDCKNTHDLKKADFNFDIVNAMLMASPDNNTTKSQLLTPRKRNGKTYGIPLHYANAKMANLLLCSSPDEDTLKKQLLFRDEKGNIPFAVADEETRIIMLESCDSETKIKLLSDPSVMFCENGDFNVSMIVNAKSVLDVQDFQKARLAMIQTINPKNERNILHSTNENFEYVLKICKRYPELFKTLLLQEDKDGNIPAESQFLYNNKNAFMLLESTPDDETLCLQFFHSNNGKKLIDELKKDCYYPIVRSSVNIDNTIQKTMFYDKTENGFPLLESMNSTKIIDILNKTNNPNLKKEILLATWLEDCNDDYDCPKYSTAYTIRHTLHSDKYKEYIANNVLDAIQADSTAYTEALELINLYKPCVDGVSKETFNDIERYIVDNNLAK